MSGITPADIPTLLTPGLKTEFMTGLGMYTPEVYTEIATRIPSTRSKETYGWLGDTPKMKEWVSERTPKALQEHGFTILNKDYESTIEVDRNAIEDDEYGQVAIRVQQMGESAKVFYDERCTEVLEAGTSELCYDGQFFFDTDHQEGDSPTQSNAPAASSTYTFDTAANAVAVAKLVKNAMSQFKTDKNKHAHVRLTHCMVPTSLEMTAREAFDPTIISTAGGATPANVVGKGLVKVLVNPFLTNASTIAYSPVYWFDLSKPVKPLIFQDRKQPEFVALDKPDSPSLFFRKKIYYGVDLRCNFGYGDWRYAYRTEGAA